MNSSFPATSFRHGQRVIAAFVTSANLVLAAGVFADGGMVGPSTRWNPDLESKPRAGLAAAWNRLSDIREPGQKAILVYDAGREDLVLQVKYEGTPEDFGWVIPVPSLPTVRQATMDSFYELSRFVQRKIEERVAVGVTMPGPVNFRDGLFYATVSASAASPLGNTASAQWPTSQPPAPPPVQVLEYKTVGAYDAAILSATRANSLQEWLKENGFAFPPGSEVVLGEYVRKGWYFVAIKVHAMGKSGLRTGSARNTENSRGAPTRIARALREGELNPLKLSFDSPHCIYPLRISSLNHSISEVHLYVLSSEPLISRYLMRPFLSDPLGIYKIPSAEVKAADLPASSKELPRLKCGTWALVKLTRTFEPEEMEDLEFESLLPLFRADLNAASGDVRFLAAVACGRFGLKEPKAVEMLLPVATEGSQYWSEKAQQALARISGKQFEFPEQWEEWWQAAKTGPQFDSPTAN